jgi:hypothetical protein
MNELNVVNERFPKHLLDRFREEALEEAKEEERREFERELNFEEEKHTAPKGGELRHARLPLEELCRILSRSALWDRVGWDKWAELHPDLTETVKQEVRDRILEKRVPLLNEWESTLEEFVETQF